VYDLHGIPLAVEYAGADRHCGPLSRCVDTVLRQKALVPFVEPCAVVPGAPEGSNESVQPTVLRLQIETVARAPGPPVAAEPLDTCPTTGLHLTQHGHQLYVSGRGARASVDVSTGSAGLTIDRSFEIEEARGPTLPLTYLIAYSLVGLVQSQSWYPLHGAALSRAGRGLVLLAQSDAGKSTAAFQLVRHGWSYVSDDNVLLRQSSSARAKDTGRHGVEHLVEAVSLRYHFCLDAEAGLYFSELRGHDWPKMVRDEVKWRVDVDQLYPGQRATSCIPRVLVLPTIIDSPQSRLEPVPPAQLLPTLLQQTGFGLAAHLGGGQAQFDRIGQLLRQCNVYRLYAGRDVLHDGEAFERLMRRSLQRA
jgi:hypothetical protein